ncbi:unnamed protein product [Didymodactylos carnosus]|uniref:C2H2-type domain-containing protein n=1 Tax=Didymodactylos carnosus TaxID=1234261 RepID=A0A814MF24_9BILA|nr:unnamed protein product [Didymodactylos carnosus]CAF1077575.1 unnamed protein product [Didymodactylos carnosus]CAF3761606.1 unnamed protein product [Didymodactylos carnosus]CAF3843865.1 unnamed protein product [Didymodactylos carnosus]
MFRRSKNISHHSAQTEWNAIKKNEELVKEKIEEYLEIYNRSGAAGLPEQPSRKAMKKAKKQKRLDGGSDDDDPVIQQVVASVEATRQTTPAPTTTSAPTTNGSPPKPATNGSVSATNGANSKLEKSKAPAQEQALKELAEINERIASLVQVKNMGLSTAENQKQLKKLCEQRKAKTNDIKRLQSKQRASTRYRERKKRKVEHLCATNPVIAAELTKVYRPAVGRPPIEEECPDLLSIIEEIARVGSHPADLRRADQMRPCLTLDDLRDKIKQRGYDIKRSSLYYRLMPRGSTGQDGKRHVRSVPVRLRKAPPEEPAKHEDACFANATIRYIKDLAGIFGNDCVLFMAQDDKCKIPIGMPAAKIQAPMLMHLDYALRASDHDWTQAPKHQLTPSVYAACIINPEGDMSYMGPTYIAIRSAKHDQTDGKSHAVDFDRMVNLKEFDRVARDSFGDVKPIIIITVDGGPDENPRFPKTLSNAVEKFRRYNLDALFILTHAPGHVAFSVIERRIAPLSHDLAGLILPNDQFGNHLNQKGMTIDVELEKMNFKKAGQVLSEVWSGNIIDEHPVVAEYIDPPKSRKMTDEEQRLTDVTKAMDDLLKDCCTDQETAESVLSAVTDQVCQEEFVKSLPNKEEILAKYELDEYWCANHVLQTQYTIQIIRCNNPQCCGQWRSNYVQIFPHRFLPPPVPFERTLKGIEMADKDSERGQFYGSLFQRIQFHGVVINHTMNDQLPFDYCCASQQSQLKTRICPMCKQYIPSSYRMKQHLKIHQQEYASNFIEYENGDGLPTNSEIFTTTSDEDYSDLNDFIEYEQKLAQIEIDPSQNGVVIFNNMLDWLKSDFEEVDIKDQITQKPKPKHR